MHASVGHTNNDLCSVTTNSGVYTFQTLAILGVNAVVPTPINTLGGAGPNPTFKPDN